MADNIYTPAAIRAAILRAADRVEREPWCYRFDVLSVPACGSIGCMWGWIGHELGMAADTPNARVAIAIGVSATGYLYAFCATFGCGDFHDAAQVAAAMRAYADEHFKAATFDAAYLAFRADLGAITGEAVPS